MPRLSTMIKNAQERDLEISEIVREPNGRIRILINTPTYAQEQKANEIDTEMETAFDCGAMG